MGTFHGKGPKTITHATSVHSHRFRLLGYFRVTGGSFPQKPPKAPSPCWGLPTESGRWGLLGHFKSDLGIVGVHAPKSRQKPLSVRAVGAGWGRLGAVRESWGYAPFPECACVSPVWLERCNHSIPGRLFETPGRFGDVSGDFPRPRPPGRPGI